MPLDCSDMDPSSLKLFCMLNNSLRWSGTDLLIQCLRPGTQCVAGGKSPNASRVLPSPQISPGTHLELGQLWLNLQSPTNDQTK